jgi:hypothetical protein
MVPVLVNVPVSVVVAVPVLAMVPAFVIATAFIVDEALITPPELFVTVAWKSVVVPVAPIFSVPVLLTVAPAPLKVVAPATVNVAPLAFANAPVMVFVPPPNVIAPGELLLIATRVAALPTAPVMVPVLVSVPLSVIVVAAVRVIVPAFVTAAAPKVPAELTTPVALFVKREPNDNVNVLAFIVPLLVSGAVLVANVPPVTVVVPFIIKPCAPDKVVVPAPIISTLLKVTAVVVLLLAIACATVPSSCTLLPVAVMVAVVPFVKPAAILAVPPLGKVAVLLLLKAALKSLMPVDDV